MTSLTFYLTLAVLLVGGVIAWQIMDAVVVTTIETDSVLLEQHTIAGATGTFTLNLPPLVTVNNFTNNAYNSSMTLTNNYTIDSLATGRISVVAYDPSQGACCQVSYTYDDATYLSSNLSRIIVTYIVPIGLLGLLAFVVVTRRD